MLTWFYDDMASLGIKDLSKEYMEYLSMGLNTALLIYDVFIQSYNMG